MLSDEEKDRLTERVVFEHELREQLAPAAPPPAPRPNPLAAFLNSSLGLFLLGSLVTAVVVPQFQRRQQEYEWKRQVTAENARYRLQMMRDCMKEYIAASSAASEAQEIVRPLIQKENVTAPEVAAVKKALADVIRNRFRANANVLGMTVHFPRPEALTAAVASYNGVATNYIDTVTRLVDSWDVLLNGKLDASARAQIRARIDRQQETVRSLSAIIPNYQQCVREFIQQIRDEEKRYAQFEL